MAANYYASTQAMYWTFTKAELAEMRATLANGNAQLHAKYPLPDPRHVNIFMQQALVKLAKRMSLRQQALATAQTYIKRFYLHTEMRRTNPYLIMTTAVYLACKIEECPQHIRLMLGEAVRQWPELGVTESGKIGECEFAMISGMRARLCVWHPYRALGELQAQFGLTVDESHLAQSIINDSYNTDLPLLYAPHVIAITAVFLAVVVRPATSASSASSSSDGSRPPGLAAHSSSGGGVGGGGGGGTGGPAAVPPTSGGPSITGSAASGALASMSRERQSGMAKLGKLVDWLAESKVDMGSVVDATQEMVSLYECWDTAYSERLVQQAFARFMKESK